jgi:hypothetical protein
MPDWTFDLVFTDVNGHEATVCGHYPSATRHEADMILDEIIGCAETIGVSVAGGYQEVRDGPASGAWSLPAVR